MNKLVKAALIALGALIVRSASGQVTTVSTAPLKLIEPYAIAVDYASGAYYISDGVQDRIVKHTPPLGAIAARNTPFTSTFNPTGIAVGNRVGLGRGLILAGADHRIHFLNFVTSADTVIAGSTPGYSDSTNGLNAQFLSPQGIAVAADGTIYVADVQNNRIRRIANTPQAAVTTVAPTLRFRTPVAVTLNDAGLLFVADNGNNSVKIIDTLNNDQLTGDFLVDGPRGMVWIGGDTGLLVADTPHNVIRQFLGTTGVGSIYAGVFDLVGQGDVSFDLATFNAPAGLAVDNDGNILVADTANNALRQLVRLPTQPLKVLGATQAPLITGAYSNSISLFVSDDSPGTIFRYTSDGTLPTPLSTVLDSGHLVDGGAASGSPAIIQIRGFNPDLLSSAVVSNAFAFFVDAPTMTPAGATNNDVVSVHLNTATEGATFYYTTDGSDPSPSNGIAEANGASFSVASSGLLKARAYKTGYTNSAIITNIFLLQVSDPVITPDGITSGTAVTVKITSATPNASIYWTIDGSTPSTNNGTLQASGSSFVLATNGTLKVVAVRAGFVPSAVVSRDFNLQVATPNIAVTPTPNAGVSLNKVTVTLSDSTANSIIHYTLDGSSPESGTTYTAPFTLDTNATIRAIGSFNGFASSDEATNSVNIKVDAPVMSPAGGIFQDGTTLTLTVLRTNGAPFTSASTIHYTLNGADPTEADTIYTGPVHLSWLDIPGTDLRQVRARAFAAGALPSDVVSGTVVTNNVLSIPRDMNAGMGATILIPVTVSLKQGVQLQSVQYLVQVWPVTPGAPNLDFAAFQNQSFSSNGFIRITGSTTSPITNIVSSRQFGDPAGILTNELAIAFVDHSGNLSVSDFATIDMLSLQLPGNARTNDVYTIHILEVSGTSDGEQAKVPLVPGTDRHITIANISYLVGDVSPGGWFNAGDFGDNNLDNSDVNMAFLAASGRSVPYSFSDVFNAMDSYPLDTPTARGGDGIIRFLDWQTTLDRSLRVDTNNWHRSWNPGGVLAPVRAYLGPTLVPSPLSAADEITPVAPGLVWFREALVSATQLERVAPGASVSVPVYITVAPDKEVSGMMFRAVVEAIGGAPDLIQPASFTTAAGLPAPTTSADGLPVNELSLGWRIGSFNPALSGHKLIGQIHFTVPAGAATGQCYRVRFAMADGSPDSTHEYNFESHAACVFVQDTNRQPIDPITDEWRVKFFGSTTNPDADAMADPDGDNVPNWKEYLAGTDPTKADSKLELHHPQVLGDHKGISLSWLTAPGKTYVVETAASVDAAVWTVVAAGVVGDGNFHEVIDTLLRGQGEFYRIRIQDQP